MPRYKALVLLRGDLICMDPGEVKELDLKVAAPHLKAGNLHLEGPERAVAQGGEKAVEVPQPPEKVRGIWPPDRRIKKSAREYLDIAPKGKHAATAKKALGIS